MTKLTVSIVNYNGGSFLLHCLESLEKVKDEADLDIWVVDNASSDNSLIQARKKYPKLNYIENNENLGFGKAHNLVLKNVKTSFVLILNPDTEVEKGVISNMIKFMEERSDVGASTCKIVLPGGQLDWAAHRGLPTPWAALLYYFLKNDSLYHLSGKLMDQPHEVDAVSGSFLLTKKEILEKVGLFDDDYFMYAEDIDLCYRIKEAGFKVMYNPEVSIVHHKGISSGVKKHSQGSTTANIETRLRSMNAFYETMKIFYKKHLEKKYPFFINWLVYLGIDLKWALAKRKRRV